VKAISIKLSQGAKPGLGGVLPGAKVSAEIAATRGVPIGKTVVSPPAHSAFTTPGEFVGFIATLRRLSGGKPIGFKLLCRRAHRIPVDLQGRRGIGNRPGLRHRRRR
jgi:glutamate synthase domain-containing protein 2